MFIVIGFMFAGIALGYLLRRAAWLQRIGSSISYTILLLLFLLGTTVGANEELIRNLPTLGGEALLLSSAGLLGSLVAAYGVYRWFFERRKSDER